MNTLFKLSTLSLALASTAYAAETIPTYIGDEIVVTATRFKESALDQPINITTITGTEIRQNPAKTLPEILAEKAGIHISSSDGTPDADIDLRGFGKTGTQNTLVLLNGQRLNDFDLSAVRWSSIPLDAIERVEILRGSGAVAWGGGASGGTINIITKQPSKGVTGSAALAAGSYDANEIRAAFSSGSDIAGLRLNANSLRTDNYRMNNGNKQSVVDGSAYFSPAFGQIAINFGTDTQTLRFPGVRRVNPGSGLNEFADDPRGTSTPNDYGNRWGSHLGATLNVPTSAGEFAVDLTWRDKTQQAFFAAYGGSYLDSGLDNWSLTPRLKMPYQAFGLNNKLTAGVDLSYWDYDSKRSTAPAAVLSADVLARQKDYAIYLQNVAELTQATVLTLGARWQNTEYDARDALNSASYASASHGFINKAFEAGIRQKLSPQLSWYGKLGRSFRLATVDEIFDPYGGGWPLFDSKITLLQPQTSLDREIGMDYRQSDTSLRAAFYHMDLNNEIHYNALTFTNMNLSPTRRYGIELEGKTAVSKDISAFASYTWSIAKFREGTYGGTNVSGNAIPLVPTHSASLGMNWSITEKTQLSGVVNYVGSQHFDNDQSNSFGQQMPAYRVADLKLVHHEGAMTLSATVSNLFNEKYYSYGICSTSSPGVYNTYPMPARNFLVSGEYRF